MKTQTLCAVVWLTGALAMSGRAADGSTESLQKGQLGEKANRNLDAAIQAYQAIYAANESLQEGLLEEEANRNLDAAIQAYQTAIDQFDEQRKVAGTAVFRLAECYRKLGKTNEAGVQYQRVVRDFADQTNLVTLSRKELDRMPQFRQRLQQIVNRAGPDPNEARERQRELLQQELKLVEQQLTNVQMQASAGRAGSGEVIAVEREILSLKRQMAALDATVRPDLLAISIPEEKAPAKPSAVNEEFMEIYRLKVLKENSPDLLESRDDLGKSPLHTTSEKGYLRAVSYLLDQKVDINAPDSGGNTPLHVAVSGGRKTIAELLLANGAEVNAKNDSGSTPLHAAADHGFKAIAEVLLAKGADANAIDLWGTPLGFAAANGSRALVTLLLTHKADVETKSPSGNTPLMVAASWGQAEAVAALLEAGANVNATGFRGVSVLHWAVGGGSAEIVQQILTRKPNVDCTYDRDLTPLHVTLIRRQGRLAELLLVAGADPNRTMNLSDEKKGALNQIVNQIEVPGAKARIMNTLKGRSDLASSQPDFWSKDWTPLNYALLNDDKNLVAILLKGGANPNLSIRGDRPIFAAVRSPDLLKLLLTSKAEVNVADEWGTTPLHQAAYTGPESVKLLLAAGANVNASNNTGGTALSCAVENRNEATVKALLEASADPNILCRSPGPSSLRGSPLHFAVAYGDEKLLRLLLAHKADVNRRDPDGNTPLHRAALGRSQAMVALLLAASADVSVKNNKGQTPLDVAEEQHRLPARLGSTPADVIINFEALLRQAGEKKPPNQ